MATSSEPIDLSGRKVGGNRSVVVTGRNPAKKPKVNLEDLCPTDEPLIFRFGGKLMRQYLNDSGLDGEEKDYDIRAICKNLVTNGTFQRAFQAARAGIFAKSPRWLQGAMRQQTPMKGHCIPYSPSTVNIIKVMQQAGTGLLILFSMDSSPTELIQCGERRLLKAVTALQKHPVTKYISRALLGLASLCLKLEPLPPAIRGNRKARVKAEQDRAKEEKITYTLIDSMERAVFEGDMEWFKKQYDSVIDQEEKLFDASQHGDDYESQTGVIRCQGCNGFHI